MIAEFDQIASAPGPVQQLMTHLETADGHIQWLHKRCHLMGEPSRRLECALKELALAAYCAGQMRLEQMKGGGQ